VRALLCDSNEYLHTSTSIVLFKLGHLIFAEYKSSNRTFRTINFDFERIHFEMAPMVKKSLTREKEYNTWKTKDMLHDKPFSQETLKQRIQE
jgi:hypothetical protein